MSSKWDLFRLWGRGTWVHVRWVSRMSLHCLFEDICTFFSQQFDLKLDFVWNRICFSLSDGCLLMLSTSLTCLLMSVLSKTHIEVTPTWDMPTRTKNRSVSQMNIISGTFQHQLQSSELLFDLMCVFRKHKFYFQSNDSLQRRRFCFFLLKVKEGKRCRWRSPRLNTGNILGSPNCHPALFKQLKHETNSVILSPLRYTLSTPACLLWWPEQSQILSSTALSAIHLTHLHRNQNICCS